MDGLGFESRHEQEGFCSTKTSIPGLESTQSLVLWVPGFFLGATAARAELRNEWSCTYIPLMWFHVEGRDNFTIASDVIENETYLSKPIENSVFNVSVRPGKLCLSENSVLLVLKKVTYKHSNLITQREALSMFVCWLVCRVTWANISKLCPTAAQTTPTQFRSKVLRYLTT